MTTATHTAFPKRILFANLLAAIGLLAASCGSSSDNFLPAINHSNANSRRNPRFAHGCSCRGGL